MPLCSYRYMTFHGKIILVSIAGISLAVTLAIRVILCTSFTLLSASSMQFFRVSTPPRCPYHIAVRPSKTHRLFRAVLFMFLIFPCLSYRLFDVFCQIMGLSLGFSIVRDSRGRLKTHEADGLEISARRWIPVMIVITNAEPFRMRLARFCDDLEFSGFTGGNRLVRN